ncbi:hypothetical protein LCGC14_2604460 [marine sediment metagenome]|uniref:Uncharacterized protein n=1 Tax=marine sediment metagenome TaxID=412755 RepID=A0A0F9CIR2_9ZZZZ
MKQIPTRRERGTPTNLDPYDDSYYGSNETNTEYLNKHAKEWVPPLGMGFHLHLIYARSIHWRVVDRASSVCKIPDRCHRIDVRKHY